jgi:hypothetical protein
MKKSNNILAVFVTNDLALKEISKNMTKKYTKTRKKTYKIVVRVLLSFLVIEETTLSE